MTIGADEDVDVRVKPVRGDVERRERDARQIPLSVFHSQYHQQRTRR